MDQVDVVIVGAGLAGLATAWHLGEKRKILMIDRNSAPGQEASRLGVGMVRRLVDDPVERALAHRTASWLAAPGADWEGLGPHKTGALVAVAGDPTQLSDAAANLLARGVRASACERSALADFPLLRGSPIQQAWHLPDEWQIDPSALVAGFSRGLSRMNVAWQLDTKLDTLIVHSGHIVGVHTSRGDIHAKQVVLAAGAWCSALAQTLGLHRPLFPLRRTVLHLGADIEGPSPWLWLDDIGLYARRTDRGWWVSPCDEAVSFPSMTDRARQDAREEHLSLARHKIVKWLPALDGAPLLDAWSGTRTYAPDRRPLLGPDRDRPGLWWAAGLGGYGASCAWAAGEAVAAWLVGESTPWLRPALVSPTRAHLSRWPIRPDGDAERAVLIDGTLPAIGVVTDRQAG